ncbi:MAG: hypothetical protein HY721_29980 [Planctomycetes bacterium]|nr:hypothetical protein [Planctomycetota bacterium]
MEAEAEAEAGAKPLTNAEIAGRLNEVAGLLEAQGANPFRVAAYRKAAGVLEGLARPVSEVFEAEGEVGLERLPGIGRSLGSSIERLLRTGKLGLLERLRGGAGPERLLETVPTIGPVLAARLHAELGIEALEDLERAANDGRLERFPGFGPKRVRAVREALAGRFRRPPAGRAPEARPRPRAADEPPVEELLDVDEEYRRRARRRDLPRISPRRLNPTGEAWLPVLHTERSGRHYTALFSNTARAHELGATRDWVVIYRDDQGGGGRWTVVTARYGRLRGLRIVRGREGECEERYRSVAAGGPALAPAPPGPKNSVEK